MNFHIVKLLLLVLSFGHVIQLIFGEKIQYSLLAVLTPLLFIKNFKKIFIPRSLSVYFLVIIITVMFQLIDEYNPSLISTSLIYYLLIPLVYGTIPIKQLNFNKLMNFISLVSIPNFIFVVFQMNGHFTDWIELEKTNTYDLVHSRYGGLFGSSLALGLSSAIFSSTKLYEIVVNKRKSIINFIILFSSFFCLTFSYSRGAYSVVIIAMFIVMNYYRRKNRLAFVKILLATSIFSILIITFTDFGTRLFSTFSITDEGNLLRFKYWLNSIQIVKENFFYGIGLGYTGSVESDFERDVITESFYLKILVEGGLMMFLIYAYLIISKINEFLKTRNFTNNNLLLAFIIFVSIAIESIFLQSLESPFLSIIFWLSYNQLKEVKKYNEAFYAPRTAALYEQ